MRAPVLLAALPLLAAQALPHNARANSAGSKPQLTLQEILESRPANAPQNGAQQNGQGRSLGTIQEQSPLLAPPQRQQFAPLLRPPQEQKPQSVPRGLGVMPGSAPGEEQALRFSAANYPLSPELLTKLEKVHAEILSLPDLEDGADDSDDDIRGGLDVLVKAMEKRADIMSVLGRNLLSAADYITAMQAAANALAAASGAGERVFGENAKISPDNLAFGKKYAARIRALLEE